jgi:CRISPR-associated protein Cas1
VQAKIRAQANNLTPHSPERTRLLELARTVRSGDVTNHEAQAARVFWSAWLPDDERTRQRSPFRRNADGEDEINVLLNYGYSILRAAVARAIVMAGLHPAFGLQHCNRSNLFCLADDLMEPLRPLVDARVRELVRLTQTELSPITKAALLQLLTQEATTGSEAGPLMVTLHRYVASLVKCYAGEVEQLEIPEYVPASFDPKSVESASPSTNRSWGASRRARATVVASELANRPF